MSANDRLERDLAVWFEDTAMPRVPDYVDDIVREAVRGRQRPRWSFVSRWLPGPIAGLAMPSLPVRWRTIALLAALVALLAAGAILVGTRPRVPPPFGLAANGLVVVARDGDIIGFDPSSRIEIPLVVGPELDRDPTWSLDGTRVAFLRTDGAYELVGFTDRDGRGLVLSNERLQNIDPDTTSWKPDGSGIAVFADGKYRFVDAASGVVTDLGLKDPELDLHFRPPDGREVMYRTISPAGTALVLYSFETGIERKIVTESNGQIRPRGFSPDGKLFVYHTTDAADNGKQTFVVDVGTRAKRPIDAVAGRLSNDGLRVAGYRYEGPVDRLCVAWVSGGPCELVGDIAYPADITYSDALNWSPNDEWLIVYPASDIGVVLIDPDAEKDDIVIPADGAGSWQRLFGG